MGVYYSRAPAGCAVVECDVDMQAYFDDTGTFPAGWYVEHATDMNKWNHPAEPVDAVEADDGSVSVQGGCDFGHAGHPRSR